MPAYNPNRSPDRYPKGFRDAFEKARDGGVGQEFRTSYHIPRPIRQKTLAMQMSGFKESLRRHTAHHLHDFADSIGTRMETLGEVVTIVSWKKFKPTDIVKEVL